MSRCSPARGEQGMGTRARLPLAAGFPSGRQDDKVLRLVLVAERLAHHVVDHVVVVHLLDELSAPVRREGADQRNPAVTPKSGGTHTYSLVPYPKYFGGPKIDVCCSKVHPSAQADRGAW